MLREDHLLFNGLRIIRAPRNVRVCQGTNSPPVGETAAGGVLFSDLGLDGTERDDSCWVVSGPMP